MAKITEKQLKKIREQQEGLTSIVNNIGALETQKHSLLHQIAEINKEVQEFKRELEKEYGPASIDLETGELTEINKEDKTDTDKE